MFLLEHSNPVIAGLTAFDYVRPFSFGRRV